MTSFTAHRSAVPGATCSVLSLRHRSLRTASHYSKHGVGHAAWPASEVCSRRRISQLCADRDSSRLSRSDTASAGEAQWADPQQGSSASRSGDSGGSAVPVSATGGADGVNASVHREEGRAESPTEAAAGGGDDIRAAVVELSSSSPSGAGFSGHAGAASSGNSPSAVLNDGSCVEGRTAPGWWRAFVSLMTIINRVTFTALVVAWVAFLISCALYAVYFVTNSLKMYLLPMMAGSAGFM